MSDTKPDLDAIEARAKTAHDEVSRLCCGNDRGWRMSIPADDARDSDLIISAALNDVEALVAYARTLEADNERVRGERDEADDTANMRLGMVRSARRRAEAAEAERDRARATAVHLEQELAQIRALRDDWHRMTSVMALPNDSEIVESVVASLDRVLDGDQRTERP